MRIVSRRLAPCALALCAALLLCAMQRTPAAFATSSPQEIQAAKGAAVSYLHSLEQADGSIAGFGGDWALTSLAAAGTPASTFRQSEGTTDARSFYRQLIGDAETWPGEGAPVTEFEKAALIANAAGIDVARVSQTQNLIAQVLARYQPASPGYYGPPSLFNGAVFGLLALDGAKTRAGAQRIPQVLLNESVQVIRGNQHVDGGWSFQKVEGNEKGLKSASEPDMTGAALAALCGAGVPGTDATVLAGTEYLRSLLITASGAFGSEFGVNTDSNAWAVEGLNACGIDAQGAQFTTSAGKTPIDFLLSQQLADGGFTYMAGGTTADEYASQDALRAIAGGGFTAPPPKGKHAPKWVWDTSFDASGALASELALVIDSVTPHPGVCAVTLTPAASMTTLAAVLSAAQASSTPAGCVTSFSPTTGKGAIVSINGAPATPGGGEGSWTVSLDGGLAKPARSGTTVHLGDTIYLRLG
jgi:hypothetical protein